LSFFVYNSQKKDKEEITLDKGVENALLQIFQATAPTRTGTLKGKIRLEYMDGGIRIISDIYYMPYTEEKWISPRWRGRANPNEGWFKEAMEISMQFLSRLYGKEFKRES
jgi:hypothetical protein